MRGFVVLAVLLAVALYFWARSQPMSAEKYSVQKQELIASKSTLPPSQYEQRKKEFKAQTQLTPKQYSEAKQELMKLRKSGEISEQEFDRRKQDVISRKPSIFS